MTLLPKPRNAAASTWRGVGTLRRGEERRNIQNIREGPSVREVDFRYLRGTLESLNSSTDLVLARGQVQAVLSHQCSPYLSRRQVNFGVVSQPLGADVLLAVNYRKILLVGRTEDAVRQAAEAIGREGRPFEGTMLGWDGPWANWVCEPVPPTLHLLQGLLRFASDYGLVDPDWLGRPLLHVAWLVPVVMEWDEDGRPVFSWPDRPGESESEPVDQDLPEVAGAGKEDLR